MLYNTVKKSKKTVFFCICSLFFTIFALAGLFLGCAFSRNALSLLLADREAFLNGSLFGLLVEMTGGTVSPPSGALPVLLYALIYPIVGVVAVSVAFSVIACLFPRKTEALACANGCLVLLYYGAILVLCYLSLASEADDLNAELFDFSSATVSLAACAVLFAAALVRLKGHAISRLLLFALSLFGFLALFYPGTPLFSEVTALFAGESDAGWAVKLLLGLLAVLTVVNAVLSVIGLGVRNTLLLDVIRFAVQAFCVYVLVLFLRGTDSFSLFTDQLLPALLLLLAPTAAFLLSTFSAVLRRKRK